MVTNNIPYRFLKIQNCLFSCSGSLLLCSTEYRKKVDQFSLFRSCLTCILIFVLFKVEKETDLSSLTTTQIVFSKLMALLFFAQLSVRNKDKPVLYSLHVSIQILLQIDTMYRLFDANMNISIYLLAPAAIKILFLLLMIICFRLSASLILTICSCIYYKLKYQVMA